MTEQETRYFRELLSVLRRHTTALDAMIASLAAVLDFEESVRLHKPKDKNGDGGH